MTDETDLSPEEFADWLTPQESINLLKGSMGATIAMSTIVTRLRSGIMRGAAGTYVFYTNGDLTEKGGITVLERSEWMPSSLRSVDPFWVSGDFHFEKQDRSSGPYVKLILTEFFDVRLDPNGVRAILPPQRAAEAPVNAETPQAGEPIRHPGGRPTKLYWEPLLIEMARQLHAGDLQPKSQAEVQRAMHDWLAEQGHIAGDTQVKGRARLLWDAIRG